MVEIERFATQAQCHEGERIPRVRRRDNGGSISAVVFQRLRQHLRTVIAADHANEITQADAGPVRLRAPAFDTCDGKRRVRLGHGGEICRDSDTTPAGPMILKR
jgi:hypothetical protein